MNTRLETTFLGAALAAFAAPAVAAIDACVASAAELSQQFQLAQVSSQDITLKVVRGTYDIAGTSLVRTDSAGPARMQSVRVLGGYAPGCATRTVDPANTIFTSSSSTSVYWRTAGTLVSIEGISFVGNGTRLSI
ncbi:MAG: hypothetical protein J0L88_11150 [Xanthomonadales bacterium]|nr:hypothetical protein [Xanthomonadales bacterium]